MNDFFMVRKLPPFRCVGTLFEIRIAGIQPWHVVIGRIGIRINPVILSDLPFDLGVVFNKNRLRFAVSTGHDDHHLWFFRDDILNNPFDHIDL